MMRPPVRWADCELPEELARVIASAASAGSGANPTNLAAGRDDAAALARIRARLHASLGPSYEAPASRVLSLSRRGKWLGAAALGAVGFCLFSARPVDQAHHSLPTREAAVPAEAPLAVTPEPLPPTAAPAELTQATSIEAASPTKQPVRSASRAIKRSAAAGLAAELRGLDEIRQLLLASPTRALAAADAQQRRFAAGALGPERELLRIEALLRAGRADEAQRCATRALEASDNPPYRERIKRLFVR
ncbi:MAG: hypothetical protein ABW321_22325 [Polyangiales bacterium]